MAAQVPPPICLKFGSMKVLTPQPWQLLAKWGYPHCFEIFNAIIVYLKKHNPHLNHLLYEQNVFNKSKVFSRRDGRLVPNLGLQSDGLDSEESWALIIGLRPKAKDTRNNFS